MPDELEKEEEKLLEGEIVEQGILPTPQNQIFLEAAKRQVSRNRIRMLRSAFLQGTAVYLLSFHWDEGFVPFLLISWMGLELSISLLGLASSFYVSFSLERLGK